MCRLLVVVFGIVCTHFN